MGKDYKIRINRFLKAVFLTSFVFLLTVSATILSRPTKKTYPKYLNCFSYNIRIIKITKLYKCSICFGWVN